MIAAVLAKNWRTVAFIALAAAVLVLWQMDRHAQFNAGYDKRIAEVAAADAKAALERTHDNETLAGKSDYDLCVVGLRGNGMPVSACEQLRGLLEKQP